MRISFSFLVDLLQTIDISVKFYKNNKLSNYKLLTKNDFLSPDLLYIADMTDFAALAGKGNNSFIIIDEMNILEHTKLNSTYNLIIIKDNLDVQTLVNKVNQVFSNVYKFENALLSMVYQGQAFDEVLAYIGKNLGLYLSINNENGKVLYKNFETGLPRLKSHTYRAETKAIGSLSLYDNKSYSKETQLDLFNEIHLILDKGLEAYFNQNYQASKKIALRLFENIVQGKPIAEEDLSKLRVLNWDGNDPYLLTFIENLSPKAQEDLGKLVEGSYESKAIFLKFDTRYIVLTNIKDIDMGILKSEITHIVGSKESSLLIFSQVFQDIRKVHEDYSFIEDIAKLIKKGVFDLETDLLKIFTLAGVLTDKFVHHEIKILNEYDKDNKDDLLETLYVYLACERSYVKTSDLLNLHRNTIVYRINKIEKIVNLDLESIHTRVHCILSALTINKDLLKYK